MNLTAREAVLIGSLIGPMQVAGRIAEFVVGARLHPLTVGTLAFATLVLSLALLTQVGGLSPVAFAFAVLYGWSAGILTIVRGTVPAELFGRHGYGALLGALAQPQFFAKAIAPAAFTIALGARSPQPVARYVLVAIAVAALLAYELAVAGRRAS